MKNTPDKVTRGLDSSVMEQLQKVSPVNITVGKNGSVVFQAVGDNGKQITQRVCVMTAKTYSTVEVHNHRQSGHVFLQLCRQKLPL